MEKLVPQILFEDNDLIILNKPAGMIVNNADSSHDVYTVQDFIRENFVLNKNNLEEENDLVNRDGIVHRLDKETSGVLLIARNNKSFTNLQKQFKNREIKKVYLALVHGKLVTDGQINVPIGRLPWNRMRFGVIPQGRESFTEFKVIDYKELFDGKIKETLTLVEAYPKTGRTHQIRVHFQYVGFPIFGDSLYSGRKIYAKDRKFIKRHFLHASSITFKHPESAKNLTIEAPLTLELDQFLKKLANVKRD